MTILLWMDLLINLFIYFLQCIENSKTLKDVEENFMMEYPLKDAPVQQKGGAPLVFLDDIQMHVLQIDKERSQQGGSLILYAGSSKILKCHIATLENCTLLIKFILGESLKCRKKRLQRLCIANDIFVWLWILVLIYIMTYIYCTKYICVFSKEKC